MQEYEIRVLNANGQTALIAAEVQLNDRAAVRSAKKIANGRKCEVWRGMDCIYPDNLAPPPQPGAATSPTA